MKGYGSVNGEIKPRQNSRNHCFGPFFALFGHFEPFLTIFAASYLMIVLTVLLEIRADLSQKKELLKMVFVYF